MTVNFLSAELLPFCKGERIIMGWVKVGVPHMPSFQDLRVIDTNLNLRSTWFSMIIQKAASFLYEFLWEVGPNNCANTNCSHGDTYVTPLYCIWCLSGYNMWPVGIGSHTRADVCILPYGPDERASLLQLVTCRISTHIQHNIGVIYSTISMVPDFLLPPLPKGPQSTHILIWSLN
jgi:hypothetical protein